MANDPDGLATQNLAFVESMYIAWRSDPASVDPAWAEYFSEHGVDDGVDRLGPSFAPRSIFNPPGGNGHVTQAPVARPQVVAPPGESVAERLPFLRGVAIFEDLPNEDLEAVARIATAVRVNDGDVFVREGDMGQDLYVITQGKVLIRRKARVIAELGPREVVGEMAVLDRQPRSADAVAHRDVQMLRIQGADLVRILDERPAVSRAIIRVLTQRLRDSGTRQDRVDQLIRAYRVRGHLIARLNPLGLPTEVYPELNPAFYGFGQADLDMVFSSTTIPGTTVLALRDIIAHLKKTYCRSIGVQYMHIDDIEVKMWLQDRMEATQNSVKLSRDEQIDILTKLTDAEIFEQFIHRKFVGAKRFSLEGAESLIPLLDLAIEKAGEHGVEEVVIGMAHRGRLNVLANILGKDPRQIFREFDDNNPDRMIGRGDVKYHLGYSADRVTKSGQSVHLSLTFNPSHLEFVSPVVLGRVRAKQDRFGDTSRSKGMGIVIHGDAAVAGQGVVQETFNLSELSGFRTGGTVHIIVNNQIGFTTNPNEGRSTQYATDIAKMLQIPIFHVNGEHPEAVAQSIRLAMAFREEFAKDVVIDMYCYRRLGHNEGDEPAFTQPLMYKTIRKRKSVREGYLDNMLALGEVTQEEADRIAVERRERYERELGAARSEEFKTMDISTGQGWWRSYRGGRDADVPYVETGVARETLSNLMEQLTTVPESFTPHPKIERLVDQRRQMGRGEVPLDWGGAESLAMATLVAEGTRVRLCGQDAQRGTFSHRHAVLHDVDNGNTHVPMKFLAPDQGPFDVYNSPLTEVAVMGFEYGYSLDYPDALVVWEAQFGDFANVAQVIIDQFITSGEDKWRRMSGLVLLLPHGFEGQGPEHSSARLERFLTAAADDNMQVVNATTPAQIFHLLRRQVVRPLRKPLVVMSPKSLLRHPRATSTLDELTRGSFLRVIGEVDDRVKSARRVLLTSGKVYYDLVQAREEMGAWDVPIVRLEQYYPLDEDGLVKALQPWGDAPVVWVQEEPKNMGAWSYLRLTYGESIMGRRLSGVYRAASASPATGSAAAHKKEQALLMEQAFGAE